MLGDAAGVVDIVDRAAAVLGWCAGFFLWEAALVPELHCETDHGLAAVVEDCGDGGAIDAAAHCYGYRRGGSPRLCSRLGCDSVFGEWGQRGLVEQRRTSRSACAT